jgi:hypothetical protein
VPSLGFSSGSSVTVNPTGAGRFVMRATVQDSTGAQSTTDMAITVEAAVPSGGGGGGLGLVWLMGLAMAVLALQCQRHRACPIKVSRRPR